jgi:hypothetical protein
MMAPRTQPPRRQTLIPPVPRACTKHDEWVSPPRSSSHLLFRFTAAGTTCAGVTRGPGPDAQTTPEILCDNAHMTRTPQAPERDPKKPHSRSTAPRDAGRSDTITSQFTVPPIGPTCKRNPIFYGAIERSSLACQSWVIPRPATPAFSDPCSQACRWPDGASGQRRYARIAFAAVRLRQSLYRPLGSLTASLAYPYPRSHIPTVQGPVTTFQGKIPIYPRLPIFTKEFSPRSPIHLSICCPY